MGLLGGIFKSLINPATLLQLAAGPAGWASLAMRTIGTAIAQQVIQQLGQKLGLPPAIINMAQQAFSAASGTGDLGQQTISSAVSSLAKQFNLSPNQEGQLFREAQSSLQKVLQGITSTGVEDAEESGSFLVAIAKALGKVMDQKAAQMKQTIDEIGAATSDTRTGFINGIDARNEKNAGAVSAEQTKISSKTALLQAFSQELSIVSNAAINVVKTVGEANVTNARKG